jgi:hypothetical protein
MPFAANLATGTILRDWERRVYLRMMVAARARTMRPRTIFLARRHSFSFLLKILLERSSENLLHSAIECVWLASRENKSYPLIIHGYCTAELAST